MREFIWILLLTVVPILPAKVKSREEIYLPKTFETVTNESVKSALDKYFSEFEFENKKRSINRDYGSKWLWKIYTFKINYEILGCRFR